MRGGTTAHNVAAHRRQGRRAAQRAPPHLRRPRHKRHDTLDADRPDLPHDRDDRRPLPNSTISHAGGAQPAPKHAPPEREDSSCDRERRNTPIAAQLAAPPDNNTVLAPSDTCVWTSGTRSEGARRSGDDTSSNLGSATAHGLGGHRPRRCARRHGVLASHALRDEQSRRAAGSSATSSASGRAPRAMRDPWSRQLPRMWLAPVASHVGSGRRWPPRRAASFSSPSPPTPIIGRRRGGSGS